MSIILRKAEKTTTLADLQDRLQQMEDRGDLLVSLSTKTLSDGTDANVAGFSEGVAKQPLGKLELFTEPEGMTSDRESAFFNSITSDGSTFVTMNNVFIEGKLVRVVVCRAPVRGVVPIKPQVDGHGTSNPHAKPPVSLRFQSPNRSHRNGVKIDTIVLHCTEEPLNGTIADFMNPGGRQVSAHYVIDRNGDIFQMVPDSEAAWHCKGANANTIGIEHVGQKTDAIAPEQKSSSVQLIKWLMEQYNVNPGNIFGHDFTPNRKTDTSCPDKLFGPEHSQSTIVAWIRENLMD